MITFFKKSPLVNDISWLGTDLHNHVLPGIDDGAADTGQSVLFAKELQQLGFSKLICTPHIFTELYPNTIETISTALNAVTAALKKEAINVDIQAAAEYMMDETFKVKPGLLCISGKHLLVEMSYLHECPNLEQLVFDLQMGGFNVVLAHPERYLFYHKNFSRYRRLKELGILFQLNLLSLEGYYGKSVKQVAVSLMQGKSYDFAGTDLHDTRQLKVLKNFVLSGNLYRMAGQYPFKNKNLL